MRIESVRARTLASLIGLTALMAGASSIALAADEAPKAYGADWEAWRAETSVTDLASLQRGARDFFNYCRGCHSLKYMRYSRMADDLEIPTDLMQKYLLPSDAKMTDYVTSPLPPADAVAWFGKAPPDLSLIARARGTDYLYQLWTTYCVDPSSRTGANNLRLNAIAMPDVLSVLEGLKRCVYRDETVTGSDGKPIHESVFDHFETVDAGSMSREQYAAFVRDIVNFLDYVGEPAQAHRRSLGVWVVLFLLVFTWLAWLLKQEYWKDVH